MGSLEHGEDRGPLLVVHRHLDLPEADRGGEPLRKLLLPCVSKADGEVPESVVMGTPLSLIGVQAVSSYGLTRERPSDALAPTRRPPPGLVPSSASTTDPTLASWPGSLWRVG
jgi:hypothetical protein